MDEVLYINILKTISLIASVVGIIIGLDMILGARIITALKRVLEKSFDFDKKITNPKAKISLGIVLLCLSLIILLLIRSI